MAMNDKVLRQAIQALPTYEPQEWVWEEVQKELDFEKALATSLPQLPQYQPEPAVWSAISEELHSAKVRTLRPILSIAAAIALLVGSVSIWNYYSNQPQVEIFFSTDFSTAFQIEADWNDAEGDFQLAEDLCQQYPYFCALEDVQSIRTELERLKEEKVLVETALSQFGQQPEFILKIKTIEQQRANLLKEMVAAL